MPEVRCSERKLSMEAWIQAEKRVSGGEQETEGTLFISWRPVLHPGQALRLYLPPAIRNMPRKYLRPGRFHVFNAETRPQDRRGRRRQQIPTLRKGESGAG